jgi:hypothetical protein
MRSTFLNLSDFREDHYVYRIFPLERLYQLFSTKCNVLVKPHKWEDPFENLLLQSTLLRPTHNATARKLACFYGQCWTLHQASDALWRIYSPDHTSVRIRATLGGLLRGLVNSLDGEKTGYAVLGAVRYLRREPMIEFATASRLRHAELGITTLAETLLIKRPAFSHEREVRLLYYDPNASEKDLFKYRFDPHELISQIMVDPRLTPECAKSTIDVIQQKTAFRGKVKRSLLYGLPDELLRPYVRRASHLTSSR